MPKKPLSAPVFSADEIDYLRSIGYPCDEQQLSSKTGLTITKDDIVSLDEFLELRLVNLALASQHHPKEAEKERLICIQIIYHAYSSFCSEEQLLRAGFLIPPGGDNMPI